MKPSRLLAERVLVQLRAMCRSYEALLKDKAIIYSEVMHEYDHKVLVLMLRHRQHDF